MIKKDLSIARQESVLACLCFELESARLIRGVVDSNLFGSAVYKEIAHRALEYLDEFDDVVGEHLPDVFDDILEGDDRRKSELYEDVINHLYDSKNGLNPEFVVATVQSFVRKQNLKVSVTKAAELIQKDDIDEAENVLMRSNKLQLQVFQPGLVLKDNVKGFVNAFDDQPECLPTGIKYFERIGLGPAKGELITILAAPNRGKSWALMHLGKLAMMSRYKVLHISLEMSEVRCANRYLQTFFSISRRDKLLKSPIFTTNERGSFTDLTIEEMPKRPSFENPNIRPLILDKLEVYKNRLQLVIKQFPTNQLTMSGLETYVDMLERQCGFIPDLVIVDYADLMRTNSNKLREDLGQIYKDLRGFGVDRGYAIASASQSNRSGEEMRVMTLKHLGEDYSKAATSDIVVSYNQTMAEYPLGLARLFVAKNRNEEAGASILLSQCYSVGQFALQSALLSGSYWDVLDEHVNK